jgi:endonuclease/exonuclease/phosphatase family metal-dependent hydrolase
MHLGIIRTYEDNLVPALGERLPKSRKRPTAGAPACPGEMKGSRVMAIKLKLATFNAENLFSRPKVFGFTNQSQGDVKLKVIANLTKELKKAKYNAAKIKQLYDQVKDYVTIVETHGKLFSRGKLKATGKADWDGTLQLKRDKVHPQAVKNTAAVIRQVDADVVCLVEVENRPTLTRFCSENLTGKATYPFNRLIDGNDDRGIDVSVISRLPIHEMYSHIDDRSGKSEIFSRDCLEVCVDVAPGVKLWVLLNHLKSKGYGAAATSDAKRKRQSERIAEILAQKFDLTKDLVAVMGDFNDTPGSAPLEPLLSVTHLYDVLELQFQTDIEKRWTYFYKKKEQIDFILVSEPLKKAFVEARVYRQGMYNIATLTGGAVKPLPKGDTEATGASDHGAIRADFEL